MLVNGSCSLCGHVISFLSLLTSGTKKICAQVFLAKPSHTNTEHIEGMQKKHLYADDTLLSLSFYHMVPQPRAELQADFCDISA